MALDLTLSATNIADINKITYTEGMSTPSSYAEIECYTPSVYIGDVCTVAGGYVGDEATFIKNGYVKSIVYNRPNGKYTITVFDILSLAVDYYIIPDTEGGATQYIGNTLVENVIGEILAMAGITSYAYDATSPQLYPGSPGTPWKLVNNSAWDYIENLSRVAVYTTYADSVGPTVQFRNRRPYIEPGDVASHTFTTGNSGDILSIRYSKSDEKLRNRVVARGAPGISFGAYAVSPYLPLNYYKTILIDHPLIGNITMAQETAERNLEMFNRLTETLSLKTIGNTSIRARDVVAVTESFTGLSNDKFVVFSARHEVGEGGYTLDLTLTR